MRPPKALTFLAAVAVAGVILSGAAAAQEKTPKDDSLTLGLRQALDAIEQFFRSFPQYEAPEILENGDIIIRRKPEKTPEEETTPPSGQPKMEETKA